VAAVVGANVAVGLDVALGVVVAKGRHPANTLVSAISLRKSRLEILRGRILPLLLYLLVIDFPYFLPRMA
jgi:hypothetical protein